MSQMSKNSLIRPGLKFYPTCIQEFLPISYAYGCIMPVVCLEDDST